MASALAAGSTFTFGDVADSFDPDHVPRAVAAADWDSQARLALTSIERQLDSIAATEVVWDTQIAPLYAGTPEQVEAMLARKTLLEQQRAALRSQLATLNQLAEARAAIVDLDRQIAQVTATLDNLPPAGRLSPDQLYVRDALTARRDLLLQERAARQADIGRLQQGVVAAQLSPVPDPVDQTTPLTQRVLDLRDHPPLPAPPSSQPAPPPTNSGVRRDRTILASDNVPRSAQAPAEAGLRTATEAVSKPVRAANRQTSPTRANGSSSRRSDTTGTGKTSSGNPSPPAERDSSEASRSDSDSDAPAPRSASASRRSSGSGSGSPSSGSSAQEAYDYAMNTPQGRMAGFIAGASGAPVG